MERTIKQLSGHSGSTVLLKENSKYGLFVEKNGNVSRNIERMTALSLHSSLRLPEIYEYDRDQDILRMEYISGLDMRTYLRYNSPRKLVDFIFSVLARMRTYEGHISMSGMPLDFLESDNPFPFSRSELLDRLPTTFAITDYIGDLTLDNIIWNDRRGFILIDPVTVPYKNVIFDVSKLRQDTVCGWFMRNQHMDIGMLSSMKYIDDALLSHWPEATEYMLILMLLRVYRHCTINTPDYDFITEKVNSLWK